MATSSYLFHARFINAKINEWNCYEKQDTYIVSKYLSTRHLLNINRMVILQWSNMANILTKYLLIWYTEKDTVPFLVFLSKMHPLTLNHFKSITQNQTEGHSTKGLGCSLWLNYCSKLFSFLMSPVHCLITAINNIHLRAFKRSEKYNTEIVTDLGRFLWKQFFSTAVGG